MKRLLLFTLLSALYVSSIYATEMYKWVDEEGNTQFGQIPPEGVQAESIDLNLPPVNNTDSPDVDSSPDATTDETSDTDVEEETPPTPAEEMQALKKKNCDEAFSEKQKLTGGGNLVVEDAKNPGQFIPLTEEEKKQRLQKAQAYLDTFCQETPPVEE